MRGEREYECYIREYLCANGVCEKTKFMVPREGQAYPRENRVRRIRRAEKNVTEAKHTAARIVNNNFFAGEDMLVTFTYSAEGIARLETRAGTAETDRNAALAAARYEMGLCFRRARNACKKRGTELRYFGVTADVDGKTGEAVRVHHHIIVNRDAAGILMDAWKLGAAKGKTLYSKNHGDLTDLVEYLLGQVRQIGEEKRYTPSRNLKAPAATAPRLARNPEAELRVPKGCSLIWRAEIYPGRPQKIRYYRPAADVRKKEAGGGKTNAGLQREDGQVQNLRRQI